MPGRIPERDIAAIRERVRIEEVVGDYVALRAPRAGGMLGLCPFHDEKSPSFNVRPTHGTFHCFGCHEGGDVFTFLQKIDHLTFVEAVEQLADRIGYTINYEGGGTSVQRDRGTRARLVAANAAAAAFYAERLGTPEAATARDYLTERGFTAKDAEQFGCGYAPAGWDTLTKHLIGKGFEFAELEAAGLARQGRRGPIDRFHRRLLWPIRNLSGDTIGFGARKLFDDDTMPGKYVNTPETLLYKKSEVLFGLDQAKRDIAKAHQAVVVEGYTDVMAMQAAGVPTAVAACGTAFGEQHLAMLRRLLLDDKFWRGEIIYTFDGDDAGRAAALKAFEGDQKISGQTFVAIAPDGMDPCELRQKSGDASVRDLVARRVPMFEFAIRSIVDDCDLDTAEGQVEALRRAVPVVARIRDRALRENYATRLSGWVGWADEPMVLRRVREEAARERAGTAAPQQQTRRREQPRGAVPETGDGEVVLPDRADPALWPQRDSLKAALQYPAIAGAVFDSLPDDSFSEATYGAIRTAIAAAGGTAAGLGGAEWVDAVNKALPDRRLHRLLTELAVEPLPTVEAGVERYVGSVLARLQEVWVGRQVADLKSRMQRMSQADHPDEFHALFGDLVALEQYRRSLLERATGSTAESR
ncbi:DNA primase [Millisia brevis]|uniref:DNA primase n=1 Tax=Millisia brevis TaxID=264148 RepID=UPI000836F1EA|nr:DNA primase [Millisia brevis]